MQAQKSEITRIIDRLRCVVQKNAAFPALEGILVKDGFLIASNMEMTIQIRCDACRNDSFIIPAKAFDLIRNLPDGDVEIREDVKDNATDDWTNRVLIRTRMTRNRYQTYPAADFPFVQKSEEFTGEVTLPGARLLDAIKHVAFAANDKSVQAVLGGVCFTAEPGILNLAASDGHRIVWDRIETEEESEMNVIVPKTAVMKLSSLGTIGDITMAYTRDSVVFRSGDCTVFSRLIDGRYLDYRRFFQGTPYSATLNRKSLLDAMTRARLCTIDRDNIKHAVVFDFSGSVLQISIADSLSDYNEVIDLETDADEDIRIGFNPNILLDTGKAFSGDEIDLSYSGPKDPVYMTEEGSYLKALILPVVLSG